jgi:hypothetical protein
MRASVARRAGKGKRQHQVLARLVRTQIVPVLPGVDQRRERVTACSRCWPVIGAAPISATMAGVGRLPWLLSERAMAGLARCRR